MYTIENTDSGTINIYLTRGDTFVQQIGIYDGSEPYELDSGDVVRFALKSAKMNSNRTEFLDSQPIINKVIPNDTLILRVESSETKSLPFGEYFYDIELTKTDGYTDTFINGKLYLTREAN